MKINCIKINDNEDKNRCLSGTQSTNTLHLLNTEFQIDKKNVPVSTYLDSQIKIYKENNKEDNGNMKVSFRGRPLNGKQITLPDNYQFSSVSLNDDDKNILIAEQISNTTYYWNLDKIPSSTDSLEEVSEWLKISKQIHSHIQLD